MTWPCGMHLSTTYLVVSFAFLELSRGVLVNRTVDDQFGDSVTGVPPTYEGPSVNGWTQGSTCGTCKARPDPYLASQGTWHDSTWSPGDLTENMVNVFFNGSAVYVFIILANNVLNVTSLTNLSFSLDGEVVGSFVHSPTSSETDYEYNVAAYTNESLGNTLHKLTMQTTDDMPILFLFDYLIYSTDDEATSVTSTSQTSPPILSQPTATDPVSSLSSSAPPNGSIFPSVPEGSSFSLRPTESSLPKPVESNPSTPSQGSISLHGSRDTSVLDGGLTGGLIVAVFVTGLILYGYRRRIRSIFMNQNFSRRERNLRPLTGLPASSDRRETTTGTWGSSSMPASTYTSAPTHGGSSSSLQTVITSLTERSDGNMATYAQTTAGAELRVTGVPTRNPGSQALPKSAERQLHLFRQIERIWQQPSPTHIGAVSDLSSGQAQKRDHEGVDEARILREQVVFPFDEIERLNARRASAGVISIADIEPPPDYSTEGRGSPVCQTS